MAKEKTPEGPISGARENGYAHYDQDSAEARKLAEWEAEDPPLDGAVVAQIAALLPRGPR